jgi:hypothetical protein
LYLYPFKRHTKFLSPNPFITALYTCSAKHGSHCGLWCKKFEKHWYTSPSVNRVATQEIPYLFLQTPKLHQHINKSLQAVPILNNNNSSLLSLSSLFQPLYAFPERNAELKSNIYNGHYNF